MVGVGVGVGWAGWERVHGRSESHERVEVGVDPPKVSFLPSTLSAQLLDSSRMLLRSTARYARPRATRDAQLIPLHRPSPAPLLLFLATTLLLLATPALSQTPEILIYSRTAGFRHDRSSPLTQRSRTPAHSLISSQHPYCHRRPTNYRREHLPFQPHFLGRPSALHYLPAREIQRHRLPLQFGRGA